MDWSDGDTTPRRPAHRPHTQHSTHPPTTRPPGEPGDRVQFSEFVAANVRLAALRGGAPLSTRAVAQYVRGELATALRNRPYQTNLLVAGWDDAKLESGIEGGPSLYWLDYLATCHPMNVAGTGYGSYFVLAMLDALWRPDLTLDEAVALMERGIDEVVKRLVVAPPAYIIKVVDAAGVRTVKTVRPGTVSAAGGGGGVAAPAVGTVQA